MNLCHLESGGIRKSCVCAGAGGRWSSVLLARAISSLCAPFGLMDAASLVLKARYRGGSPSGAGQVAHLGTNPLLPRGKLQVCELPPDGQLPQPHNGVGFAVRLGSSLRYPFHTHTALFSFAWRGGRAHLVFRVFVFFPRGNHSICGCWFCVSGRWGLPLPHFRIQPLWSMNSSQYILNGRTVCQLLNQI